MRKRCEALEWENSDVEKELVELRANADAIGSLLEEVDQYGRSSVLASRIKMLKSSHIEEEKCNNKVYRDATEVCHMF